VESARADIEYEIFRRAQEGVSEPIYGGRYREQVVGIRIVYSDRLLGCVDSYLKGLATHRYPLRPLCPHLHVCHSYRRHRLLLALINES